MSVNNNNSANCNNPVRNVGAVASVKNSASSNTNNVVRNAGAPSHFGNSGMISLSRPMSHQAHLLSHQSQPQIQGGSHFPGHFQLSEPQARAISQAQYSQAHAQSAAHTQFQTQAQPAQLHSANASNINIPPSISTPGSGSAKRPTQKPPSRPPGSSNIAAGSPFKTMELTPAGKRKKTKLPEKQIPDKVADLLPESALYTQLLEFEAQIDAVLARKKINIQESMKKPPSIQKILRIYVFNTFENTIQSSSDSDQKSAESPHWSLKIIGRILEDGKDPVITGDVPKDSSSYPKFSSFFKKITIYLDQNLYPDNHVIVWESARSSVMQEGFKVKRKGEKEFTAVIRLEMNYVHEKFRLSPALSDVLGIEMDTRPRIMAALWHYVKVKKLQNSNDPSFFTCDPGLQKVFGEEKIKFSMVSQKISQQLLPPQPIQLQHRIKLSGNCPTGTSCYDVAVDVPFPLGKQMSAFLESMEKHEDVDTCDELITAAVKKINKHHRRRAFFLAFSQSPAEFINTLISSQSTDLKLVAGDASLNAQEELHSNFYCQSWVEDAVIRYLNRKSAGGNVQ